MKNIPELDAAIANREMVPGTNYTFWWAYRNSHEAEADLLDFSEVVWDTDIEPILADCKKYGITEFTISSTFSSLLDIIAKFIESGCKMDGLVYVKSRHIDIWTREQRIIPALKMTL